MLNWESNEGIQFSIVLNHGKEIGNVDSLGN